MNPINRKIIVTEDGSSSIYDQHLHETYHSIHGAVQESRHVFIESGLNQSTSKPIRVLEVGFGTGLNALLTIQYAIDRKAAVELRTLELHPVEQELVRELNYAYQLKDPGANTWFDWIHELEWGSKKQFNEFFSLEKSRTDWLDFNPGSEQFDVIFYDAFAPSKQPDMWSAECIEKACRSLKPDGIFVTYSARGQLKRDLANYGMTVESLPGPPGKKEMTRARKIAQDVGN